MQRPFRSYPPLSLFWFVTFLVLAALPASGASIGDRIWRDLDGEGDQDPGEVGLANMPVRLECGLAGICPQTTSTDANGLYQFTNLPPGTYTVRVTSPVLTDPSKAVPSFDFDGTATKHRAKVTIGSQNANKTGVDFGYLQVFCLDNSPAFPVPEFRNGIRLWPENFRPAQPGVQLPANRDSTGYSGRQLPGASSGLEFFSALEIDGGTLYTAYNSGFHVWNITGPFAEDPQRLSFRDGWLGHFLKFQDLPTELYFLIWDLDVIDPPGGGNDDLVVLAGEKPAGLSIWDVSDKTKPIILYQDWGRSGRQVRVAQVNGRSYAFFATFLPTSNQAGLHVYDLTRARENYLQTGQGCLEDSPNAIQCPGVHKGKIGNWPIVRYVDVIEKNGKSYVAFSDAGFNTDPAVEIRELQNLSFPSSGTAFRGADLQPTAKGIALFEHGGRYYMGVKAAQNHAIYDITHCLDSGGCNNFGAPVWTRQVGEFGFEYVNFSKSGSTPYLHFGTHTSFCEQGTQKEWLYDLSELGSSNPNITTVTASGLSYSDLFHGLDVDYWGSYYDGNTGGFSMVMPHMGKFRGPYFYRAAWTIFDVHVLGDFVEAPTITTLEQPKAGQPPYWMDDEIDFTALASSCQPAGGGWTWDATTGAGVSSELFNSDQLGNATFKFHCDTASRCPDERVTVTADNTSCVDAELTPAGVTVLDARPPFPTIAANPPGGTYPVCTVIEFSGEVGGKPPIDYRWLINGAEVDAGTVQNTTVSSLTMEWNTEGISLGPEIFLDGFESGDLSAWSLGSSAVAQAPPSQIRSVVHLAAAKMAGNDFDVSLELSNAAGSSSDSTVVTLTPLAALGFDSPAITVTPLADGQYQLRANSTPNSATEWKWEFEQTDAQGNPAPADVLDWSSTQQEVIYTWAPPNVADRDYTVKVWIRNCSQGQQNPPSRTVEVFVDDVVLPEPPVMSGFAISPDEYPNGDCDQPGFGFCNCDANASIDFDLSSVDNPSSYELDWDNNGTVDDSVGGGASRSVSHSFPAGNHRPRARAVKGGLRSDWFSLPQCTHGLDIQ